MLLTLGEAKTGCVWSAFTNLSATDSRLVTYLNEAVRRLLPKGKWVGTYTRDTLCLNQNCITWRRQYETIEAWWECKNPGRIRNEFFETNPNSFGLMDAGSAISRELVDRGSGFCQQRDIYVASKIRLYPAYAADAGKTVLVQGYDPTGEWIRTPAGVGTNNGELLTLALPYVETANFFNPPGMFRVQKPVTKGPVTAYSVDPVTAALTKIAYWEPDETLPDYRRSLVPGLDAAGSCGTGKNCDGSDDTSCDQTQITVLAKLKFIPAVNDTDYLLIGNLPALKEMVQAILKGERGLLDESEAHEVRAVRLLEEELMSHEGSGVTQPFKVEDSALFGAGYIENPVNSWDFPFTR